ncbi:MAG: MobA/MobL family protein, partial [Actinobacteria bacterium]|nr:MobA/MobL family protein [Actinomycetota bacterium]
MSNNKSPLLKGALMQTKVCVRPAGPKSRPGARSMAIYHCSVKTISRSAGRSSTAAAAYRSGEAVHDERTGETHDYTRKQNVLHTAVLAPHNISIEREDLWNRAEHSEKRKNSTVAREYEIALPVELDRAQQQQLATGFAQHIVDKYGVAADVCIHDNSDSSNPHAHILTTTRAMNQDAELCGKTRVLDDRKTGKQEVTQLREVFADMQNQALGQAGSQERVDHRSYADQGLELKPTIHLGVAAAAMERRGEPTEKGNKNRETEELNKRIQALQQQHVVSLKEFKALIQERDQLNNPDFLRQQIEVAQREVAQREQIQSRIFELQNVDTRSLKKEFIEGKAAGLGNELFSKSCELHNARYAHEEAQKKYEQLGFFKRQLPTQER